MTYESKFLIAAGLLLATIAAADVTVGKWIFKTNSAELPAGFTLKADNITSVTAGQTPPGMVPIGGMVAVMPSTHVNAWQPPADCSTAKDGFMRTSTAAGVACTVIAGQAIPAGTTLPNMHHKYPRGGATSGATAAAQKLVAANIPQISTSYTPAGTNGTSGVTGTIDIAHSHTASTVSGTVGGATISATDGTHTHTITDPGHGHVTQYNYMSGTFPGTGYGASGNQYAGAYNVSGNVTGISINATNSVHGHGFTLSAAGHTLASTPVNLVSGSAAAQVFTGTAATITVGTAVGSQTVVPEPPYTEVVWVIRVK